MTESEQPIFREVQQFRQRWLWLLMALSLVLAAVALYATLQEGSLSGIVGVGVMGAIIALFYWLRLITEVRSDAIHVRFVPQ